MTEMHEQKLPLVKSEKSKVKSMKRTVILLALVLLNWFNAFDQPGKSSLTVVCPKDASTNIKLAASEVRRYIYLRTGNLLSTAPLAAGDRIQFVIDKSLEEQQYSLKSDGKSLTVSGGSDIAVLYGTYAFIEKLGVRFELNGDVIPSERIPLILPPLDETHKPLFALRGLQPFHDFPEGPDWWTEDQWRLYLGQAVKMRMNFVGLHCYPYKNKDLGPEPLVWVGLPRDVNPDGTVKRTDEASWYTTAKYMPYGCYAPGKTGDYGFGASGLFPADDYGPQVNGPDDFPMPKTPEARTSLINRTGNMFRTVFTEARGLGVKVAVGTEAPLDIPDGVMEQLKAEGKDPENPETLREVYRGMFTRIQRTFPIDYYWLWGYEGEIDEKRFVENISQANLALKDAQASFSMAICGWGWTAGHFPAFDSILPKNIPFSAINMSTGHAPVSPNFGKLGDRSRWAIPWLEDDGSMIGMQFRVGRIRRDAADASRFGCDGLMGIFWRTRIMSPNITALSRAGWEPVNGSNPPTADLYRDWATAQFGPGVASEVASILSEVDGNFPMPSSWIRGPGVIVSNQKPWSEVAATYRFIGRFAGLRPLVQGAGEQERFDFWLNTLKFNQFMGEFGCSCGELDGIMQRIATEKDPAVQKMMAREQALPLRLRMTGQAGEMTTSLIESLSNSTELGTLCNVEQQSMLRMKRLTAHDSTLEKVLGESLPEKAHPWKEYRGTPRLVVMNGRTSLDKGEAQTLQIIALDRHPVESVIVKIRLLGKGRWKTVAATNIARAVWSATLPEASEDFEYQVIAKTSAGTDLHWPVTAPNLNQTIVIRQK